MDRRGRYRNRYRNRSQRSQLSRSSDALLQATMGIVTATPIPTPIPTAQAAPPFSCTWVRTVHMSYCYETLTRENPACPGGMAPFGTDLVAISPLSLSDPSVEPAILARLLILLIV
jgi:hypothetical protein